MKIVAAVAFLASLGVASAIAAEDQTIPCGDAQTMIKVLKDKGYRDILSAKGEDGIPETIWLSDQSMVVTALKDEKTVCYLTQMTNAVVNPETIETIYDIYKDSNGPTL
jgi:hypothetical protein